MPEENKLFFGNLPQSFSNNDFTKLVSHFGAIGSVRLLQKEGAQHNKYGFVTFKDKNHATEAKKHLHEKSIAKHQIFVDFARSSNDLVIKQQKNVNRYNKPKPKAKRKFPPNDDEDDGELVTSAHSDSNKRRKLSVNPYMSSKKIPPSRIVVLSGVPHSMSFAQLKQRVATAISQGAIQYLIYPANDSSLSKRDNVAWILHQNVQYAQHTIDTFSDMAMEESGGGVRIEASFARKLNKLYRVRVSGVTAAVTATSLKQFLNQHFDRHYQQYFDEEENRKFAKMLKYTKQSSSSSQQQQQQQQHQARRGLGKKRKKSNNNNHKTHDVIQHVKMNVRSRSSSSSIIVEFKKVDYALFAVQHMHGVQFDSSTALCFRFELESAKSAAANAGNAENIESSDTEVKLATSSSTSNNGHGDDEPTAAAAAPAPAPAGSDNDDSTVVLKMFHIAKSVQLEQLRAFLVSIIRKINGGADSMVRDDGDVDGMLQEIIYPAPDSLPDSRTAWICLAASSSAADDDRKLAPELIRQLRATEINGEAVGITMADQSYVKPQTIMVRNLPNTVTQDELRRLFERFGRIAHMSMKSKLDASTQHSRWCFITFRSVRGAAAAIESMNGFALKSKLIACDYTLPKDMYHKIQKKWQQQKQTPPKRHSSGHGHIHAAATAATGEAAADTKRTTASGYQQYEFMRDYEEKSFYRNFCVKDKENKSKVKALRERVEIPVSSEPAHYDWLKFFLRKSRRYIMQYDTNCKIHVHLTMEHNHVQLVSDNASDLQKGVALVNEMMHDKQIREIGYTQVMNIPFECEHQDFDWILYLNGDAYCNRKKFESHTGCSFMFTGKLSSFLLGNKADLLQLKLVAPTHKALQRGAQCMKEQFLRTDVKHERQSQMEHKLIKRIYFPSPQSSTSSASSSPPIDYISLIISPNGQRLKQIEQQTNCKLRVFGSSFENKKNMKSYCTIMAKTQAELDEAIAIVHDLLHNEETQSKAIAENFRILNEKKKKTAHAHGNDNNDDGDHVDGDDNDAMQKKFWFYSGDANEGRTVFVRNLPFDATEDSILEKFREFGRIVSVKLVFDKVTGNPRGSCFVQFDNTQSVSAVMDDTTSLTINGRRLIVNVAINKREAKRIETDKRTKDTRNLYLAKEGVIMNEQEMSQLSPIELNRRIEAWKEKQAKLQNPNFHVSKTRLSLRNIPGFVRPNLLKQLFHDTAVRMRLKLKDTGNDDGVFEFAHPKLLQSKIVKKSRFGFIEFREHSDALLVLRELNNTNNAEIFSRKNVAIEKEKMVEDNPAAVEDEDEDEPEEDDVEEQDEGDMKHAIDEDDGINTRRNKKQKDKMGRIQIEFAVENMKKIHIHNEKVRIGQMKWRKVSMEKLKDKMKILKAQKQEKELKVVQNKMTKLQTAIKKSVAPKKKNISKKAPKKVNKWTTTIKRF